MSMKQKVYNKGMEAGSKPFPEKFEKQADKVDEVATKIAASLEELSANQDGLIDCVEEECLQHNFGLRPEINIQELSSNERRILLGILMSLSEDSGNVVSNDSQKSYLNSLYRYLGDSMDSMQKVEPESIIKIADSNIRKEILQCIMDYAYLEKSDLNVSDKYKKWSKHYFSPSDLNFVKEQIENRVNLLGVEGLINKFAIVQTEKERGLPTIEHEDIIDIENMTDMSDEPKEEKKTFFNNTKELYPEVRSLILKYMEDIPTVENKFNFSKMVNFISANYKAINPETAVAIIDFTISGNGKAGILFTTAGFYIKNQFDKNVIKCKYKDIKDLSIEILGKKDRNANERLIIERKSGAPIVIQENVVNESDFMRMLDELKRLAESGEIPFSDSLIPVSEMNSKAKSNYIKSVINVLAIGGKQDFSEAYKLMCRINCNPEERAQLLKYCMNPDESVYQILEGFDESAEYPSKSAAQLSLVQSVWKAAYLKENKMKIDDLNYINQIAAAYGMTDDQLKSISDMALLDKKILEGSINQKEIDNITNIFTSTVVGVGARGVAGFGFGLLGVGLAPWILPVIAVGSFAGAMRNINSSNKESLESKRRAIWNNERDENCSAFRKLKEDESIVSMEILQTYVKDPLYEKHSKLVEFAKNEGWKL